MGRQPYQSTEAWRAERRTGYGASDAPILVEGDEAAWRQLHGEKLGLLPDRAATETMDLGKRLEHTILRMGAEREGWRAVRVNRILRHPDLAYVFASLDGRKIGDRRPIEVKKWGFKSDDWGPAGSDIVPVRILYQVQQQAAVTVADAVELLVLFGGSKLERFTIGRDQSLIDELLELETAAWAFVARGEMPPWPGQAPRRITLAADEIPVDDTILNLVDVYTAADERAKVAAQDLDDAKDRLRAVLADVGGAKGVLPDGRRLSISHRPQEPAQKVTWELVASAYRKALESHRPLLSDGHLGCSCGWVAEPGGIDWREHAISADPDTLESLFTVTAAGARPLRINIGKEAKNAAA